MKIFPYLAIPLAGFLSLAFTQRGVKAQECQGMSKTAFSITDISDKDSEWVCFANAPEIVYAYDKNGILRLDSMRIRIRIKRTPKQVFYIQVKTEKMMEHRSLQNYEDRGHPQFDYEGYERYGFTIAEEEIDGSARKYKILEMTDYDTKGEMLSKMEYAPENASWIESSGRVAETALIDSFNRTEPPEYPMHP